MNKELKQMREYINAMKKVGKANSGDCDNLLIHLDNIDKYLAQQPQKGKDKKQVAYRLEDCNRCEGTGKISYGGGQFTGGEIHPIVKIACPICLETLKVYVPIHPVTNYNNTL